MGLKIYRASEQELISGCLRGDRIAQQRLYDTYSPRMYGLCCRYLKDPMLAEDALVTAFTRILDKIGQYKSEGSLEGWIKTIVIRESLLLLRKNQHLRFETDFENTPAQVSANTADNALEAEDLMKMINEMPLGYKTVFNLFAIDGFSHKEIAEQLHINENTSKSQLSRARIYLQQKLAEQDQHLNELRNDIAAR